MLPSNESTDVIVYVCNRTGASHVVVVSHLTRRSTTAEARGDAEAKADTEPVTLNNPAVRPCPESRLLPCSAFH